MNSKKKGEIGERISIGELAKFGIDVAIPLTDNLPFDYIIIYKSKLFKAQVKSATPREDVCEFDLSSNNWYSKTTRKYTKKDVDVFILCDFINVFMLAPKDFEDKRSFTIRYKPGKVLQKTQNNFEDYLLSDKLVTKLLS